MKHASCIIQSLLCLDNCFPMSKVIQDTLIITLSLSIALYQILYYGQFLLFMILSSHFFPKLISMIVLFFKAFHSVSQNGRPQIITDRLKHAFDLQSFFGFFIRLNFLNLCSKVVQFRVGSRFSKSSPQVEIYLRIQMFQAYPLFVRYILYGLCNILSMLFGIIMSNKGLAFCGGDWSPGFCTCKCIEFILSGVLLMSVVSLGLLRIKRERQFNFFVIVCLLMIATLVTNMIYTMIHYLYIFNTLENFFLNMYFITIVLQVCLRFLRKYYLQRKYLPRIAYSLYLLLSALFLAIVIIQTVKPPDNCDETFFLVVNALAMILSICLVIIGFTHDKRQKERIEKIYNKEHLQNPLNKIWIWMSLNVFSQFTSLIESLIFKFSFSNKCHFTTNNDIDQVIKFIFTISNLYLGMVATIVFYSLKYNQNTEIEEQVEQSKQIELVTREQQYKLAYIAQ